MLTLTAQTRKRTKRLHAWFNLSLTIAANVSNKFTQADESIFICIIFTQDILNGKILLEK